MTSVYPELNVLDWPALVGLGATLLYFLAQCVFRLFEKRWKGALFALLRLVGLGCLVFLGLGMMVMSSMFGPSEDYFADHLTIPEGIEIAEPERDESDISSAMTTDEIDEFQGLVRKAMEVPGDEIAEFTPDMPSLRLAATDHVTVFADYVEASPHWHVFIERGNRFASRSWNQRGEPQTTMHGYISEFSGDSAFQTRCLICLDRKQWSRYTVQHVEEGKKPVKPKMSRGNNLHESRVMIDCG
jgi:hypothetical protein